MSSYNSKSPASSKYSKQFYASLLTQNSRNQFAGVKANSNKENIEGGKLTKFLSKSKPKPAKAKVQLYDPYSTQRQSIYSIKDKAAMYVAEKRKSAAQSLRLSLGKKRSQKPLTQNSPQNYKSIKKANLSRLENKKNSLSVDQLVRSNEMMLVKKQFWQPQTPLMISNGNIVFNTTCQCHHYKNPYVMQNEVANITNFTKTTTSSENLNSSQNIRLSSLQQTLQSISQQTINRSELHRQVADSMTTTDRSEQERKKPVLMGLEIAKQMIRKKKDKFYSRDIYEPGSLCIY